MTEDLTPASVEEMLLRGPFHKWLGLHVKRVDAEGIEMTATWREEWVVNPQHRYTHGGILAALIDLTADWSLVVYTGRGVPTIDMRIDYHRAAMPGDLLARGRVIKRARQFSVAEASVFDQDGTLLASGRGVYLTAQPKG